MYSQYQKERKSFFQEIKSHLHRSTSQVSMLLSNLEKKRLIERTTTRPQQNTITPKGIKALREHSLNPLIEQLEELQLFPHSNDSSPSQSPDDLPNAKNTKPHIPTNQFIEFYVQKISPQLRKNLERIKPEITDDLGDELLESIIKTIERSLRILLDMMEKYR